MSRALRELAADWLARGEPAVVVEVVATRGSVPREAGARMLVAQGTQAGTIGGGHLEWRATATSRAMLADATLRPDDETFALGAALGQCCGGAVTLRYRMLDVASLAARHAAQSLPTIQVYGAGHVGRAVVHVLATLDVHVQWIDERESEFPDGALPSNVERICVESVEAEVATAPADAMFLVLTHRHDLDLRIVETILRRGDFAFVGLIGSMTKRRRFTQLLIERGIDEATIGRMTCPIGVIGIASKEPAHIAIAVAAQVLPIVESALARGDDREQRDFG